MLRIKRIKFENWKNFPKAEIELHDRLFVIGPNASGKSNFLDIFRFLRDISQPSGGGLREAVDSRGGVGLIRRIGATSNPNILIDVELEDGSNGRHTWEYLLRFNQDKQRVPKLNRELVKRDGKVLLDRPDDDDKSDPLRLTQTSLEQVLDLPQFDRHRFRS